MTAGLDAEGHTSTLQPYLATSSEAAEDALVVAGSWRINSVIFRRAGPHLNMTCEKGWWDEDAGVGFVLDWLAVRGRVSGFSRWANWYPEAAIRRVFLDLSRQARKGKDERGPSGCSAELSVGSSIPPGSSSSTPTG